MPEFIFWKIIIAAFLLTFLILLFYSLARIFFRKINIPSEPAPRTRGMPLDWAAPVYDWYCPKIGLGINFRKTTVRHASIRPGERVLDVGCGTGVLTRVASEAAGPSGRATGIDPGPKMIGIARENAAKEGSRAEFELGVIEKLPFDDNTFDCVLSSFMIHHLPPDLKLAGFREVYRVLKPGGRFLAVDVGRPTCFLWWLLVWPLLFWRYTRAHVTGRLPSFFHEAGFKNVETAGHWMGLGSFWLAYKPMK